jgi:aquaporin Z
MPTSESEEKQKKRFLEWLKVLSEFEVPWKKNFDDPKLEYRRLFLEALGTFFLVLVAVGGNVVYLMSAGADSLITGVVAPGLMVMGIILFMGNVSGAHLNPVVSIAFAVRG